jgi:hypothetical protein
MAFVHELDVAAYFIDTGYVTRARAARVHLRDVDRRFEGAGPEPSSCCTRGHA